MATLTLGDDDRLPSPRTPLTFPPRLACTLGCDEWPSVPLGMHLVGCARYDEDTDA